MLDAQLAAVYPASPNDPSRNSKFGFWSQHHRIYFLNIVLSTIIAGRDEIWPEMSTKKSVLDDSTNGLFHEGAKSDVSANAFSIIASLLQFIFTLVINAVLIKMLFIVLQRIVRDWGNGGTTNMLGPVIDLVHATFYHHSGNSGANLDFRHQSY